MSSRSKPHSRAVRTVTGSTRSTPRACLNSSRTLRTRRGLFPWLCSRASVDASRRSPRRPPVQSRQCAAAREITAAWCGRRLLDSRDNGFAPTEAPAHHPRPQLERGEATRLPRPGRGLLALKPDIVVLQELNGRTWPRHRESLVAAGLTEATSAVELAAV